MKKIVESKQEPRGKHQMVLKSKKKLSTQEDREEKISNYLTQLKQKHNKKFTPMQCQIWSEMKASGIHASLDEPPSSSMYECLGKYQK